MERHSGRTSQRFARVSAFLSALACVIFSSSVFASGLTVTRSLPAPRNFRIRADSSTQLTAAWSSGGGTTAGFWIAFAAGSTPPDCSGGIQIGLTQSYTRAGMNPNATFAVSVCAYDARGNISQQVSGSVTMPGNSGWPPPSPYNFNVWADSSTQLTASWASGGGDTVGFWIAFAAGPNAPVCSNGIQIGNTTSYTREGMNPNATFSVSVCAYDAQGNVSEDVSGSVTMPGNVGRPPPAPRNFIVRADSATQITAAWSSGGGDTEGYWIAFAAGPNPPVCSGGIQIGNTQSYTRTGMDPGRTFSVAVCSYDSQGNVSRGVSGSVTMPGQ